MNGALRAMTQIIADRRDVDFVLHEQFQVCRLGEHPAFSGYNRKSMDMVLSETKSAEFFIRTILPVTLGKMDAMMDFCSAAITISDASFGGK